MKSQTNGRGCAACDAGPDHDRHSQSYWMPVASAVLFAAGLVMQYTGVEFFASSAVRFCWYLAAYFPVGLPVLREAWNGMRQRDFFTEYTLMSLAAIGAFYIGEYPEGVAVMLFYSIGEALQERAVAELKSLGIEDIRILSGDREALVANLGRRLGVSEARGDLLPEGKMEILEALRGEPGKVTAFVGDGFNDAPALATSDVGVAMGALGSDAAIETADVVIQSDQPSRLPAAIRIGRLTHRIVRQNILLAIGVKVVVLTLGALGIATMWEAVFADVGVTLLAVLNAVRASNRRF